MAIPRLKDCYLDIAKRVKDEGLFVIAPNFFNICEREFPFRKIGYESERKGYYFSQDIDLSAGRQK